MDGDNLACRDFAEGGYDHTIFALHEGFRALIELARTLGSEVNQLIHIFDMIQTIFDRNACHRLLLLSDP
jgi:hypothetical protein